MGDFDRGDFSLFPCGAVRQLTVEGMAMNSGLLLLTPLEIKSIRSYGKLLGEGEVLSMG